jgi:hypothetical protein
VAALAQRIAGVRAGSGRELRSSAIDTREKRGLGYGDFSKKYRYRRFARAGCGVSAGRRPPDGSM